jgi:hypothetical protein
MSLISNTGTLTITDGSYTWVPTTVGQWIAISGTAMSSAPPVPNPAPGNTGPQSKVIAWNSFAIDTRDSKIRSVANGGHADYGNNEVNLLTLETNSPAWTQEKASSSSIQFGQVYNNDGSPSSRHSFFGELMNETDGRVMLLGGAYYDSAGGETFKMDSYNIVAKTYNAAGTHPDITNPGSGEKYAFCRDPRNDNIYAVGGFVVRLWTRSTNTWSVPLSSGGPNCYNHASAYDTTRNRVFVVGGGTYVVAAHFNTSGTMARTNVTLTGTVASTIAGSTMGGMVYVPSLDAYLLRLDGSGGTVYQINASTFACTTFSTTGGTSVPATQNGPYTKFTYAPRLKCCIYIPQYSGNCWALRVEA